jgi:Flp pilus assembly protein TadG
MVVLVLRGDHRRRPRGSAAQSLVEFALIVPFLTLLFLGAVDLTRAFYYYIALENATRETARVLIDFPYEYDDAAACAAGQQEAQPFVSVSCGAGTLWIVPAANTSANPPQRTPGRTPVTVYATTTFQPITVLIQAFTGGTITLKASTTMLTWY